MALEGVFKPFGNCSLLNKVDYEWCSLQKPKHLLVMWGVFCLSSSGAAGGKDYQFLHNASQLLNDI